MADQERGTWWFLLGLLAVAVVLWQLELKKPLKNGKTGRRR